MRCDNADMICQLANNDQLVKLKKHTQGEWEVDVNNLYYFYIDYEYQLTLESNKEAVLHYLNGGEIEVKLEGGWSDMLPDLALSLDLKYRIKEKKKLIPCNYIFGCLVCEYDAGFKFYYKEVLIKDYITLATAYEEGEVYVQALINKVIALTTKD